MTRHHTSLSLAIAGLATLLLSTSVSAQDATSTPTPTPAPTATATAVPETTATARPPEAREGWTLFASDAPAFSLQLPPGWQEIPGDSLLRASSDLGALVLANEEVPAEEDFDAYVTRLEAGLEKKPKRNVPTVFRSTGLGLVARLDIAPGKRDEASEHTALFLFPACVDGARTVSITGEPPAAMLDGAPDAWDQIAAAVNPCSAEPAAEFVLAPALAELSAAYFALATEVNEKRAPFAAQLDKGGAVGRWTRAAGRFGQVYEDYLPQVAALPWTPETEPLGDALETAYEDIADLFDELSRAKTANAVTSRLDDIDAVLAALTAAGREVRLALGLPTIPQ